MHKRLRPVAQSEQALRWQAPLTAALVLVVAMIPAVWCHAAPKDDAMETIELPAPRTQGSIALEQALARRRSVREYATGSLTLTETSQLLWAAQGISSAQGLRTAPSAGALYPLETYLVVGEVEGLSPGVYRYAAAQHQLLRIAGGDKRSALAQAALDQSVVKNNAAVVVFAAIYARTTIKYGDRGIRYAHMEAGHAAQSLYLQAHALGLGTVAVGAFRDSAVQELLQMTENEQPLYLMPVGRVIPSSLSETW